jgi:hypothetical protein
MTLYPIITSDTAFPYGEENTVASFHLWMKKLFDHAEGCPIFYDKDNDEFVRTVATFPSINIQQIDTQDLTAQYIGGKANKAKLLFYIYFSHHLQQGGSRRLLRRGRDQIAFALKMAGVQKNNEFVVDPIYIYDFSTNPPTKQTTGALSVDAGIQQRFIQNQEILQYEFMLSLSYIEQMWP